MKNERIKDTVLAILGQGLFCRECGIYGNKQLRGIFSRQEKKLQIKWDILKSIIDGVKRIKYDKQIGMWRSNRRVLEII